MKRDTSTPADPPSALSGRTGVRIVTGPQPSKPGDFVDLRAEMNLVVGVTACSTEESNDYSFKPMDLRVFG